MKNPSPLSVVILAKNEERTIGRCLGAATQMSDDVVVILDDGSTDRTLSICSQYRVRVVRHPWQGYAATKNYGISLAACDWILSLDADEVADDSLIKTINNLTPVQGTVYLVNRLTYFGDRPIKWCGWFPEWNRRIFNRRSMMWNQNLVHEQLTATGPVSEIRLSGILHHYSFRDEEDMQHKFDKYARLRATEWISSEKPPSLPKRLLGPAFRFFKTYIIKLGFLEGHTGWTIAKNDYLLKRKELLYYHMFKSENS